MTRGAGAQLLAPPVDPRAGAYLVDQLARWLDRDPAFGRQVTGAPDTWVIWDEVVTAHLLGLTREETRDRPVLLDDLRFAPAPAGSPGARRQVRWVTAVDAPRLWRHFAGSLQAP